MFFCLLEVSEWLATIWYFDLPAFHIVIVLYQSEKSAVKNKQEKRDPSKKPWLSATC